MNPIPPDFPEVVRQMRMYQKRYFANKQRGNLFAARDYERRVDDRLVFIFQPPGFDFEPERQ